MGASVSVTTANLVMEALEKEVLREFKPAPKVFLRYVDDCFCILHKDDVDRLLQSLNSIQPTIQFTLELEENGKLPFLDVLVRRSDGGLSFSVYRKMTHTGRYLHFASCHPTGHKTSVVSSLIHRATHLCSSEEELQRELLTVRQELSNNGYSAAFVRRIEKRVLNPQPSEKRAYQKRASIPYIPGISEALSRIFSKYDLRIAHVPSNKLRSKVVNVKDRLQDEKFPGVIYKIPCQDCNFCYIGETGNFIRRLKEHKRDVQNHRHVYNALAEHVHKSQHSIAWENAAIMAKEKNPTTRLLLESLLIQTTPDTVNRTDGNMPQVYARSLRHILHI